MATQHGAISVTFIGDSGITVGESIKVALDDTKTLAELSTDVAAIVATAWAVTNCGIARQELVVSVPLLGGVSATASPDADVEFYGEWNMKNATTPYTESVVIPGLKDSLLLAGKINSANSDVGNWEASLTAAATNGTRIEGRNFHPFSAVKETFLGIRSRRKALHSGSVDKR